MRLRIKIALAAVSTAAIVTVGTIAVIRHHHNRRKHAHDFLPEEARSSLVELCSLKGEDFIPDRLGTSLYQRKLESLNDRQLIAVYIAIKVGETLRARGVDLHQMSKADIVHEAERLHQTPKDKDFRRELLGQLGSLGAETALRMLKDGLIVAGIAD